MPLVQLTHDHFHIPRENLGRFVLHEAERAGVEHGISYVPSINAPSTYDELLTTYAACIHSGAPFPISPDNCQRTIYTSPQINWAFRFVHDLVHIDNRLSFTPLDEVAVGAIQLEALRAARYGPGSVEHRLLHADTIGQTFCSAVLGRFPYNQRLFVYDCLHYGVDAAVEREAVRDPFEP
jgi:hypothetical protein